MLAWTYAFREYLRESERVCEIIYAKKKLGVFFFLLEKFFFIVKPGQNSRDTVPLKCQFLECLVKSFMQQKKIGSIFFFF